MEILIKLVRTPFAVDAGLTVQIKNATPEQVEKVQPHIESIIKEMKAR